jgi:ABC-type Fe3+-hydroxamate transport system substrate-binding protein
VPLRADGPNGEFGINVSTELLAEVLEPAEFIVMATFPAFEGAKPLADNPLWGQLPAVRDGAVVEVNSDAWYQDTALTRMARLDDIEDLARRFG